MRLEKLNNKLLVWTTGRQKNEIEYDSERSKSGYTRRLLSYVEDFLRVNGEILEADLIKIHMGKILKFNSIPQLVPTGNYKINTSFGTLDETIDRYVKEYGLDLNPDFQRHHVWNLEQRIAFVEFILQGGKQIQFISIILVG